MRLLRRSEFFEHGGYFVMRSLVKWGECLPPLWGERQAALTGIRLESYFSDQALAGEPAHNPAHIAGIQTQVAAQVSGGELVPIRQFIQDADFSQRVGAVIKVFVENAKLPRVKAVE